MHARVVAERVDVRLAFCDHNLRQAQAFASKRFVYCGGWARVFVRIASTRRSVTWPGSRVLNGRARWALDSTVLDDPVATQDTVTELVAAIRKVRKLIPAPCEVAVSAHDYDRGGKPDIAWHDEVARDALVPALIVDVLAIIDVLPVTGSTDAQERAVALLTLVAGHDVEPGDQPREWRIARARTSATRCDEQMHRQRAKLGRTGTGA